MGGGVSIFIKEQYDCLESGVINDSIIESVAVDVQITNEQIINVIGIYKPPSANVSEFNNMLETKKNKNHL